MNAGYFFSLYWRNVKGAFIGGFVGPVLNYESPIVLFVFWIAHIALLPLTLTLAAGIKTIVDCSTRDYTRDKETLNSIPKSIVNMTEQDTIKLVEDLSSKYTPKKDCECRSRSNSSTMLISSLSAYKEQSDQQNSLNENRQKIKEEREIQEKHIECALKQLHPEASQNDRDLYRKERYQENYLISYKLNLQYQTELDTFIQEKVENQKSSSLTDIRASLSAYMTDEKNNGKKLFQLMVAFFTPKNIERNNNHSITTETDRLLVNRL